MRGIQFRVGLLLVVLWSTYAPAVTTPPSISKPWIRLPGYASNIRVDGKGRYLAFTNPDGKELRVLDIKSGKVFPVTKQNVDQSYFWAPDSVRLFYREMVRTKDQKVKSILSAYDMANGKSIELEQFPHATGFLTFDPRDLRLALFAESGIHSKRIYLPDERLANWQVAQRTDSGKYVVTQKSVIWLSNGGFTLTQLKDDGLGVVSFDLSPDASSIVWATKGEKIFVSRFGEMPRELGVGIDPRWHPHKPMVIYSAARKIGKTTYDYDLRLTDLRGSGRFLTNSPDTKERWATFLPNAEKIIYTKDEKTDLFEIPLD